MQLTPSLKKIAVLWGIGGFLLLLVFAIYRLSPIVLEALSISLTWPQLVLLIANTLFMAFSEGYAGFQKGYSPRLISRAQQLYKQGTPLQCLLAPLYCMNYFAGEKRRMLSAWLLTAMIVILIIVFHQLPQPWRGILDAGVIVGLSWGSVATLFIALKTGLFSTEN